MAHAASVSGSCPLAGRSRGRRCLKTAHERGTAFLISANVTDFQRSVKSPNRGTWPITPSNVLLCLFQHLHRLFLGRQSLRVPGTLCHTRLLGPPYMGRVRASDHPKQQCPVADNTAGLRSQTRHPPLGQILPSLLPTLIVSADLAISIAEPGVWVLKPLPQCSPQAQLAPRAPGESGITSREPGVPRSAVEAGKGQGFPSACPGRCEAWRWLGEGQLCWTSGLCPLPTH